MALKVPQKKFLGPKLREKKILKNRLSIRVRNFAPLNEPLNIPAIEYLTLGHL
jgi:hypothetical protein